MKNNQQNSPLNDDNLSEAGSAQTYSPASQNQQPQGSSGLAIAGMILGIVGVATSILPIINNLSFFIGIVGLILAVVGLVAVNKGRKKGRGFAIAGLVLNVLTIVAVLASQAFYSAAIDSALDSAKAKPASSSQQADSGKSEASSDASSSASAYEVSIDGARLDTDYEGNRAIVVTYTFTNNSNKEAMFSTAISDKAFQNGVELETAINSSWNSGTDQMKTIKTGSTITVSQGFKLVDSSPVTVEVKEMFDFKGAIIAEATFDVA